ncbi:MAG: hypothetical protein HS122_05145 [Opitutaceae bacterium]|nr:hypothetical protein [Opitutaceae bacterium]
MKLETGSVLQRWAMGLAVIVIPCVWLTVSHGAENQQRVRFTDTVPAVGGKNLVPNGSFEAGSTGWSSLGRGAGYKNAWAPLIPNWGNFESLHGQVEKKGAAHGQSFLRIRLGGENTPVFNFDYFRPVNHRELRPLAANLGWIEVVPGETYTISLDMRASREGVRGAFGVQNDDAGEGLSEPGAEILKNVTLTQEWRRYSHTFVARHPFLFVLAGPDLTEEENVAVDVDAIQLEKGTQATDFAPRAELEVGVTTTALSGVFTVGDAVTLKITASNDSDKTAYARFSFKVTDYADLPVELTEADLEIPARGAAEKVVSLPPHWRGFYRIQPMCSSGDFSIKPRLLRVAIVPPRTTTETVMGVNHAYPTSNLLALAKKAGITWYRDWSLKWQHIEPARGDYHWEVSDPQVHRVTDQGLNLMAMIPFPSAEWNSTAADLATIRKYSPRHGGGGQGDDQELLLRARWAWLPEDPQELNRFVSTSVKRYQDRIQVWEFLNEALFTLYSLPSEEVLKTKELKSYTFEDYLALLRTAVPAIRSANPQARIVGGGMFPGDVSAQRMLKNGLLDFCDILGVHDYPSAGMRNGGKLRLPETLTGSMDTLLETMAAHGGIKPLWMTEFSYFGTDDLPREPFVPIPGLWSEPQLLTEKQVADYTIRYATLFLARGGEKIFLHSGCTGSVNKPGTESCLFADGAVRKIFPALAVFNNLMGATPRHVTDRTVAAGFGVAFESGSHATVVLWDPSGQTAITVPTELECQDAMGGAIKSPTVLLSDSPIYLLGTAGSAREILSDIRPN